VRGEYDKLVPRCVLIKDENENVVEIVENGDDWTDINALLNVHNDNDLISIFFLTSTSTFENSSALPGLNKIKTSALLLKMLTTLRLIQSRYNPTFQYKESTIDEKTKKKTLYVAQKIKIYVLNNGKYQEMYFIRLKDENKDSNNMMWYKFEESNDMILRESMKIKKKEDWQLSEIKTEKQLIVLIKSHMAILKEFNKIVDSDSFLTKLSNKTQTRYDLKSYWIPRLKREKKYFELYVDDYTNFDKKTSRYKFQAIKLRIGYETPVTKYYITSGATLYGKWFSFTLNINTDDEKKEIEMLNKIVKFWAILMNGSTTISFDKSPENITRQDDDIKDENQIEPSGLNLLTWIVKEYVDTIEMKHNELNTLFQNESMVSLQTLSTVK
jgi:hypothetical protein